MANWRPSSNFSKKATNENFAQRGNNRLSNTAGNQSPVHKFEHKEDQFNTQNNNSLHNSKKNLSLGSKFQKAKNPFQNKNKKFQPKSNLKTRGRIQKPFVDKPAPKIVSDLQITDGKHIGKYLQASTSPKSLQTSRHLRETLFKIIFKKVCGGRFLDLCAGIGTIGIEAISRGAVRGTFVDRSAKMGSLIKNNLEIFQIKEGHGEVFEMEVVPFLKQMGKRNRRWDVVFFDPGFGGNYEEVLQYFQRGIAIEKSGVLIIAHHSEMFFPENLGVLKRWCVITQNESSLSFYEKK